MAQAFINISPQIASLCATHILLTPNERLAREYQVAYDAYQLDQGKVGWPTLRCMSLSRYFSSELSRLDDHVDIDYLEDESSLHDGTLLESHTLLDHIINHAPTQSTPLAHTFAAAWQTMQRYDIDIEAAEFQTTKMAPFHDWFQQVTSSLPKNALLEEHIGDYLVNAAALPEAPLALIDFDQLTAVETRYLDFAAGHCEVLMGGVAKTAFSTWGQATTSRDDMRLAAIEVAGFGSFTEEIAAAAAWAHSTKLSAADARIGIVVPNLAQNYELVQRQCAVMFDPQAGSLTDVFDLSAGVSLFDQPVWRHARQLLQAMAHGFDPDICRRLGQSPFLALGELVEISKNWPKHLPQSVAANQLAQVLVEVHNLDDSLTNTDQASFASWAQRIQRQLKAVEWPRLSDLNSSQFQAFQALDQALETYQLVNKNSANQNTMSFDVALQLLDAALQQRLFAPQRPRTDIWVLGMLETTGLNFTHLWVCGMDENSFPSKSLTNPFMPRAVAIRHGVPRSTQADELEFAQRQLMHWQQNSQHLTLSFCLSADDNEQLPSPLLSEFMRIERSAPSHPYLKPQAVTLESYSDRRGDALDAVDVAGGTGLLKEQAACPFKAYAQYRLGLRQPVVVTNFPNALIRGNLLHDTLFDLVRRNSSQAALTALTSQAVSEACHRTLAAYPLRLPELFVHQEVQRLTSLIINWLSLEGERQPFNAVSLEQTFTLNLAGLEFRIRVDRIDRVDEHLVVIDYKTGAVSLSGVTRTPTTDPQLPAYSLIDEEIAGVYYAEVRSEPKLKGVAADGAALEGSRPQKTAFAWPEQRTQWRRELESLAESFVAGEAAVEPIAGACTYCHLRPLCRIDDPDDI